MWDGGKNGHKGGIPTWRALKNARRSPAGVFLPSKMLAGVPLAFFSTQKCSLGSRWHFLALKNARWGTAGIFWHSEMLATNARAFFGTQKCWRLIRGHFLHSEMLATDSRAFFSTQKCWRLMRGHFFALRNAGD